MKPFSQACENNKSPILEVLREAYAGCSRVLEIGSGTGQHAAYFAAALPHLEWHTSDRPGNHDGIRQWVEEAALPNLHLPFVLDVNERDWKFDGANAVFTANTAHIMDWPSVRNMIAGVGAILVANGVFVLYGPMTYNGRHTSDSNARFDASLRARDPASGIRDFDALQDEAARAGMRLLNDHPMPANNRILVWQHEG